MASASDIHFLQSTQSLTDEELLAHYAVRNRDLPWLRANFVSSIDGASTHEGVSGGLGTESDGRVFALLRRLADVIVVGAGTVRQEGYRNLALDDAAVEWRTRNGLSPQPPFALVSGSLTLDPQELAAYAARPLVITTQSSPEGDRERLSEVAEVIIAGENEVDTVVLKRELAERGYPQQHSEGGPKLFATMIREGIVDELCLTVSPRLEGGSARRIVDAEEASPQAMTLAHALSADDGTLLLRYVRAAG
ncbi:riboflavin biosynthesis pyrimidine reductase [Rhodoglobus vestalii]|uniref:Riboflavin biosynthesis pyrimidine reductase n=1 Tax=Rhodoglobus vestalii TaxID=193384 RepID=A0A8H2PTB9_9MICO|nr:pyrimidine reductase family protein [Rhodoglobus vestalii]TQO19101.1 riboflavin biosynthesis pyrimidine reductase [Rhodoglobus vestalii]